MGKRKPTSVATLQPFRAATWQPNMLTEQLGYKPPESETVWLNNRYQVHVTPVADELTNHEHQADRIEAAWPFESIPLTHLSIKRLDKRPIREWRDLLWIKNQLCGEDCEAIEIFPAMSRLVDTSNQYHLWVFPPGYRLPFGMAGPFVAGGDGQTGPGRNRQQPLPSWYPNEGSNPSPK